MSDGLLALLFLLAAANWGWLVVSGLRSGDAWAGAFVHGNREREPHFFWLATALNAFLTAVFLFVALASAWRALAPA